MTDNESGGGPLRPDLQPERSDGRAEGPETFSQAQGTAGQVVRYVANAQFDQAVLFFDDGSFLQFEHKARDSRWAKASAEGTAADRACRGMTHFRLNALHLQLYFEDGSDAAFTV